MTAATSFRLDLPHTRPPLSMNDRSHWAKKAKTTKQVRETVRILALAGHLPKRVGSCTVSLHYAPRHSGRIDADNLTATLKPCCDGLVDAGLVDDDTPDQMTKLMPIIHPKTGTGVGRLWLEIEVTQEDH